MSQFILIPTPDGLSFYTDNVPIEQYNVIYEENEILKTQMKLLMKENKKLTEQNERLKRIIEEMSSSDTESENGSCDEDPT